uniref:Phosphatidylinositol-specific phospholipase C X domain-containing protein n=2 Tax=Minutocellus polymorphus TaxID=265543 RepID=A0A7S0ARY0_9STRA|mmetsp:Transcript_2981/g.5048  ORF Transcript_2981/g.5048 Transcript_2981/m.5048 type:complete len:390 (+) Transcript_2981:307-1476(+)
MASCNSSRGPFCTWMVAGSFLVVFLAVMIMALVFSPIDQGVAKVIPNFEPNEEQRAWILKRDTPTASPTVPLEIDGDDGDEGDTKLPSSSGQQYKFIQCDEGGECCNGNALNCNLRLNEMSFATVHNANSAKESSSALGYNHLFDLDGALVAGYRAINLDVCRCDGKIRFCHNFCDFGSRDVTQVLLEIMKFLMNNVSEVVVLIFQFSTGNPTAEELYEVMQDVDGFTELMYVRPADPSVEWPLMRDLVKKGQPDPKRIVVFQYNGQDCAVASACAPLGINNYFSYTAETNFDFGSIEDMRNVEESCKITRGPKEGAAFYGVNTFVTPPDEDAAAIVNALSFIRRRLNRCAAVVGLIPNFIFVDFWSLGDVPFISQARNVALAESKKRQ